MAISFSVATLISTGILFINADRAPVVATQQNGPKSVQVYVWSGVKADFKKLDFDGLVEQAHEADVVLLRDLPSVPEAFRTLEVMGDLLDTAVGEPFCRAWLGTQSDTRHALLWKNQKIQRRLGKKTLAKCGGRPQILPLNKKLSAHIASFKWVTSGTPFTMVVPVGKVNLEFELNNALGLVKKLSDPAIVLTYTDLKRKKLTEMARERELTYLKGTSLFFAGSSPQSAVWFKGVKGGGTHRAYRVDWNLDAPEQVVPQVAVLKRYIRVPAVAEKLPTELDVSVGPVYETMLIPDKEDKGDKDELEDEVDLVE